MRSRLPFIFSCCVCSFISPVAHSQKTKVEEVPKICQNLSLSEKPVAAVASFKIAVANSNVGTGLSDMLMNALLNCGCYRVVERERLNVVMEEQGLGLSGAGDEASFASVGKQIGAQLIVMGTITEFSENESGGAVGGGILRRAPLIGGAGMRKAHIGYTIRLVNPSTGELMAMQSFDKKRSSVGVAGGGIFGSVLGGGVFYQSKAMQDAVEESLIEAVGFISQKRGDFMAAVLDKSNSGTDPSVKPADKANCSLLTLSRRPKFMVIIPEEHLAGAGSSYDPNRANTVNINVNKNSGTNPDNSANSTDQSVTKNAGTDAINTARNMFRPPDPAGETEIIKKFLEFGFEVVDAKQYEKLRGDKQFMDAFDNPKIASQLASKFGADIIIVGEAFSEYSKGVNNMTSCRARVEAKAIVANDARILATDGLHGSGLDVSEVIAGKAALKSAGAKIADYFLAQLCSKSAEVATGIGGKGGPVKSLNETEIKISNVDFAKASAIAKLLQSINGVTKSERTAFADKIAVFSVQHSGTTDALIEKLVTAKSPGLKLEVVSLTGNSVNIDSK